LSHVFFFEGLGSYEDNYVDTFGPKRCEPCFSFFSRNLLELILSLDHVIW
jgi:hypothetical protein